MKPILIVYEDGGENPAFKDTVDMLSHPEAVEHPPKEIVLGEDGKPLKVPPLVQVAAASQPKPATTTVAALRPRPPRTAAPRACSAASPTPARP